MDTYVVVVEGLDGLADIAQLGDQVLLRARQAVNSAARAARAEGARRIKSQVAFPSSYLTDSDKGRLYVSKLAKGSDLEAVIRGRERPTSLARFVSGSPKPGVAGVKLQLKPGRTKALKGAFLLRLRQGSSVTDTKFNLGLAIRTKGPAPRNAYKPKSAGKNLWLLYGPSVNQVFKTVSREVSPYTLDHLDREFARLMELD